MLSRTNPAAVQRTELATGVSAGLIADVGAGRELAWADVAGTQIAVADNAGRILLADLADPGTPAVPLLDGVKRVWAVALARPGTLVAGVGDEVLLVDLPTGAGCAARVPAAAALPLELGPGRRRHRRLSTFDDLVFRVEPPDGRPGVALPGRELRRAALRAAGGRRHPRFVQARRPRPRHRRRAGRWPSSTSPTPGRSRRAAGELTSARCRPTRPTRRGAAATPSCPRTSSVIAVLGDRNVAVVIAETSDSTALSARRPGRAAHRLAETRCSTACSAAACSNRPAATGTTCPTARWTW